MVKENDEAVTREKTRDQVILIGLQHLHRAADFTTTTTTVKTPGKSGFRRRTRLL